MFLCISETVNSAIVFSVSISVSFHHVTVWSRKEAKKVLCSMWVQYRVDLVQVLKCPALLCLGCIRSAVCSGLSVG